MYILLAPHPEMPWIPKLEHVRGWQAPARAACLLRAAARGSWHEYCSALLWRLDFCQLGTLACRDRFLATRHGTGMGL